MIPLLQLFALTLPTVAYDVSPLPVPLSCSTVTPTAINDTGQVALICASRGSETQSFLVRQASLRRIGEFGTGFARHEASDLNAAGQVAGSSWAGGFPAAAWVWSRGSFQPLGTLGGANAACFAINDAGQGTGWSNVALPQSIFSFYAFLWSDGGMTNLGELPEATWSNGAAIDGAGRVVGTSSALGTEFSRAILAGTDLGMHSLGTLGGLESWAADVNDAGEVVGRSNTGRIVDDWRAFHAFHWKEGVMHDLGGLAGDEYSSAQAIDGAGRIVGWSKPGFFHGESRAVLWLDGVAVDLNEAIPSDSGWTLLWAADLNAAGRIVGVGSRNGRTLPFVLTPRPCGVSR